MRKWSRVQKLRPLLHKMRKICYRVLGIQALMEAQTVSLRNGDTPEHQEQMQRLMDRVVLLESFVNWRLYGLPGKTGSLSFEMAATLGQSIEIKDQVQRLVEWGWHSDDSERVERCLELLPAKANVCLLLSPELADKTKDFREKYPAKNFTFVADPGDLLSISFCKTLALDPSILNTSLFNALSAFPDQHFDFVWMSDSILQTDGLKALVLLDRARQALQSTGIIGIRLISNVRPLITTCLHDATKLLNYWARIEMNSAERYGVLKISENNILRLI